MGSRACNHRTLGRRPTCELDTASSLEAIHRAIGDFAGTVYFVDPNHPRASNQHAGTDPDYPLRTVAAALTRCSAYTEDVIAVMHNAYWVYADPAAARMTPIREAVTVTCPGVRILGVAGSSSLGVPWVPPANNANCITIRAMDVLVEGFVFWDPDYLNTGAILAQWDGPPYGENLTVRRCYFSGMAYGIRLDYTYNCRIFNNHFQAIGTYAIANPGAYGDPDYAKIIGNQFEYCDGAINLPNCDNEVIKDNDFVDCDVAITLTNGEYNLVHNNRISGSALGANNMIDLTGGGDNMVSDNWLSCTVAQYDTTCSDQTSGAWINNHCTNGDPVAPPT